MATANSPLLVLLLVGLATTCCRAAAAQASTPEDTVTVPLPTDGTPFTATISACRTVPPFVVVGAPNASFDPGQHTIFLPPQASAIATSFTHRVAGSNVTEIIVATPLPGDCAPLSLPGAATDTIGTTHTHTHATPFSTGTSSPSPSAGPPGSGGGGGSGGGTGSLPPYANTSTTPSLCPLATCADAILSASARRLTSLLNEVTLATQSLEFAALELGGSGDSSNGKLAVRRDASSSSSSQGAAAAAAAAPALEPRFNILRALVLPLEDIAATLSFDLPVISAHPVFPRGCDSDTIAAGVGAFVDAQTALLQILLGKADLLGYGGDSPHRRWSREAGWRRDDEVGEVVGGGGHEDEDFYVPYLGSLIRGALKLIRKGVDELVFELISILPARAGCLRREREALDDILDEVIAAFS